MTHTVQLYVHRYCRMPPLRTRCSNQKDGITPYGYVPLVGHRLDGSPERICRGRDPAGPASP